MHKDQTRLDEMESEIKKAIFNADFGARTEDVNAVEAWRGSLPGDGYRNVRRVYLHTINLADCLPISAVWTGEKVNPSALMPSNTPPLMITTSVGATPYRLHLHVSDVGHTLIVGPTGAGKSTLLAKCAPGVEHWHGATPNDSFAYIAVTPTATGKTIGSSPSPVRTTTAQSETWLWHDSGRRTECFSLGTYASTKASKRVGPFEQLQNAGMSTAHLDEIVRQKDPALKAAVSPSLMGMCQTLSNHCKRRAGFEKSPTPANASVQLLAATSNPLRGR